MTTLLSTRHLLAQSDLTSLAAAPTARRAAQGTPHEPGGVQRTSAQSRDVIAADQGDACPKIAPVLIGPGDDDGGAEVMNPVRFRWQAAPGASRYRVTYSRDGSGSGKELELGVTTGTELVAVVPLGPIKWRVYSLGPAGSDCSGANSNSFKFTAVAVCTPPSISVSPASASITAGRTVTLTATTKGAEPDVIRWYRDGQEAGTGRTFTSAPLSQSTTFRAEAVTSCGTATSNEVHVDVCTPVKITAQPQGREIAQGASATLTVAAEGSAPLAYAWYAGATRVGTSSATLETGPLTKTTTYRVEVSNACGSVVSSNATITVKAACDAPSIVAHPAAQTIDEGRSARLTVAATGTQPLTYQWYAGTARVGTNSSTLDTGALTQTTTYSVVVTNACGQATSNAATITVRPDPSGGCRALGKPPVVDAVATVTSGVAYTVRWSAVANATGYTLEEADDPSFQNARRPAVSGQSAKFTVTTSTPVSRYYRVRGVSDCDGARGEWSAPVRVAIVPPPSNAANPTHLVAPHGSRQLLETTVTAKVDPSAVSFTATSSEPWMTVRPASGGVPPGGVLAFTVTIDPAALPQGTSTGTLRIATASASRGISTNDGGSISVPISLSLVTPVMPPVAAPSNDVLIIPAVAHADGNNSRWQSDVRIAHTYPFDVQYDLTFTPSGASLVSAVMTTITVPAGQTLALDDVLGTFFGAGMAASGTTGVLEVRALDTQGAYGRTLATSRLFNDVANGSYGQFIAGVPLARFLGSSSSYQALVALAQSSAYRTNLGIVEGSGNAADVLLEAFDAGGAKLFETTLQLAAGEHRQITSLLAANGIDTANARIDVRRLSARGSVFGYASVIDNSTGDPSFIPPVNIDGPVARRYTIAGVANLPTFGGEWQTDVRLFNASSAAVTATVEFFPQGQSAPAAVRELTVAPAETLALDDVLQSLFGLTGQGGALRIATPVDAALVASARTYHHRGDGTYGQFIPAATDMDAIGAGDAPLQILQVEESSRFRTNVGLTEVSGKEATVEVSVSVPGSKTATVTQLTLAPNEFRQLNSLLASLGMQDAYNARVAVRVIGGAGRVIAYGSVIDNRTQDPTYVMGM